MSLSLMVRVMEEVDVTRPKQAVLLAMAEHANDDGSKCFPSVDRIAWKANYKPRAVTDVMRELKQDEILQEVVPAKSGRPAEYHIHLDKAKRKPTFEEWRKAHGRHAKAPSAVEDSGAGGAKNAPVQSHERGVQSHERGVQSHERGVQSHENSARENAPEPSVEPQSNRQREPEELVGAETNHEAPESLPDDTTSKCLLLLSRVKGFPRDHAANAVYLAELRTEFPNVDAAEIVRRYQLWHEDNPGKTKNYRGRLRSFFERAASQSSSGGNVHSLTGGQQPRAPQYQELN